MMTVRDGELKRVMRHSSSWPERAVTVKVRINPETRAYTIIPTFYADNYASDKLKCGSDDATRICIVEIEESISRNGYEDKEKIIPDKLLSCLGDERPRNLSRGMMGENTTRDRDASGTKHCNQRHEVYRRSNTWPIGGGRTPTSSKCRSRSKSFRCEYMTPRNDVAGVETADVIRETNHACDKCTAEGLLQLKIDPFRVPAEAPQPPKTSKRNCPESGTFKDRRYRSQSTRYNSKAEITRTNLAQRSKSFGGHLKNDTENGSEGKHVMDQRKEATLRRHYYPEGGWGYVIVTCSALVHFLGVGLQLSAPGTWHISAELKFHHPPLHSAGETLKENFSLLLT